MITIRTDGVFFFPLGVGRAVLFSFHIALTLLNKLGEVLHVHFILKNYYKTVSPTLQEKYNLACVLDGLLNNLCV